MKRAIFTFLAIVTFLSCAAQNPKAKVFNNGIKVLGSSTVTTVGAGSRLVVVDADKNHVEITFDNLKTQLALAGGAAYTAGDGLNLSVTEFEVDSETVPRIHPNSTVKKLEFSIGTIAQNDAAGLTPDVIRYDTDGAAATDGYVDGLSFAKVGDVYTITATRNGLSDLTANFTVTGAGGAATWGAIAGTLADQTDLNTQLGKMFQHNGSVSASGDFNMNSRNITGANYILSNILGVDDQLRLGTNADTDKGWGISVDETSNELYFGSSLDVSPTSYSSKYLFSPTGALTDSRHVVNKGHLDAAIAGVSAGSVADNSITNAKLADMGPATFKGRNTGTGDPQDLTVAQAQALLEFSSGTFTPTITDEDDIAYSATKSGSYYKIGKMCYVRVSFSSLDFTGSPTGKLKVGGLPFTAGAYTGSLNINIATGGIIPTDNTIAYYASVSSSTTSINIYEQASGGIGNIPLSALDPGGSGILTIEGVYITN